MKALYLMGFSSFSSEAFLSLEEELSLWSQCMLFLPETTCLTLSLEQDKDVAHTHGALHVAHNGALVLKELHTHLSHSTTAASAAKHLDDLTKLGFGVLSRRHYREEEQKKNKQKHNTKKV